MVESKEEDADNGIQVFLRIRPSASPTTYFQRDDIDLKSVLVKVPKNEDTVNNSRSGYNFAFSGILDDKASQKDVFRTVGIPALRNALAGFNSTIFAYGQTGSGKTFTITGGPEKYDDRGIIPRSIAHLFKAMKSEEQKGASYSCFISYLEIYNQSGYDLLMENNNNNNSAFDDTPKVTMLEDEDGHFHFKNLSMHMVSAEEDALNLLFLGDTNRAIAATEMNQNSTRSHCIFTIVLEKRGAGADTVTRSKLNIVDLAGSERVGRTSSAGQTLREAKYINSSLFFLEMVIVALHEKETRRKKNVHVPYRNSMMTSVLRDSLGGNCKTIMIAAIAPEPQYTDESISTCHFAQRVALVKNSASVNEEVEPEQVIQRLKAEVRRLREEVEFLSGKNDDDDSSCEGDEQGKLPQHQMNELTESIHKYVEDRGESTLDFCGGITLPKIRAVCSIFKEMFMRKPKVKRAIDDDRGSSGEESSEDEEMPSTHHSTNSHSMKESGRPRSSNLQRSSKNDNFTQERDSSRATKTRYVCGVPVCREKRILDEPNVAFSWFKDRYPGLADLDGDKSSLKMKYIEAKNAGKRIDEIRLRIGNHKVAIEKLRKRYAISVISGQEQKMSEGGISHEEKLHCDAIEQEKASYKKTLEHLRGLKGTIENAQKKVENGRLGLQSDFDIWYHKMCSEDSRSESEKQSHTSVVSSQERTQDVIQPLPNTVVESRQAIESTSKYINHPTVEAQTEFKLPPEIKLTGNAEADADIIAFFKAKQVLLSKSSLSRR